MISKKQLTKTHKIRKVLTEQLQNSDRLDITDLLQSERDTIDIIIECIQQIPLDQATTTYIYNLVNISDMLLNNICTDFLDIELY